jgi:hypothetical protein
MAIVLTSSFERQTSSPPTAVTYFTSGSDSDYALAARAVQPDLTQ